MKEPYKEIFSLRIFGELSFRDIGMIFFGSATAKPEVTTDISAYQDVIGTDAKNNYKNKWDMVEDIFPKSITENMNMDDFKMVYYNPWDAQYLSYLVVDYAPDEYEKEVKRLVAYPSTTYKGYFGVEGFGKEFGQDYELLAIEADSYQGFIYALTNGKERIIYEEIIFCNYFMDLDYKKYIDTDYLPVGFDATDYNPYRKQNSTSK